MPTHGLERFEAELAQLLESLESLGEAVVREDDGETLLRVDGDDALGIRILTEPHGITVSLAGWSHAFRLGAEDVEDDLEEVAAALDLVAAALFGELRVVTKLAGDKPHHWTLQLREPRGWNTVSGTGRPALNPFAKRSTRVLVNQLSRPAGYEPSPTIGLPWAPWAGMGGFSNTHDAGAENAELPVDGVLDLHNFHPKEVKPLVLAYIEQCRERGISELRIIHGKGKGQLRRTVHSILDAHEHVIGYRLGGHGGGSWGATIADLRAL